MPPENRDNPFRPIRLLLLVPFIAVLIPPFYNRLDPVVAGIPFFYWYQMLWIFITAAILGFVHWFEGRSKS